MLLNSLNNILNFVNNHKLQTNCSINPLNCSNLFSKKEHIITEINKIIEIIKNTKDSVDFNYDETILDKYHKYFFKKDTLSTEDLEDINDNWTILSSDTTCTYCRNNCIKKIEQYFNNIINYKKNK